MKGVRLRGDSLFESFIVRTVFSESEVNIKTASGQIRGFITGIDEEWLQITDPHKFVQSMVKASTIQELKRTNVKISGLQKDSREKMKSLTFTLRKRCSEVMTEQQKNTTMRGTR